MAKSLRSKSVRKARALKRELVFKPIEDARTQRLAEKLSSSLMLLDPSTSNPSSIMTDSTDEHAKTSSGGPARRRNRRLVKPFSLYGLSAKELKF